MNKFSFNILLVLTSIFLWNCHTSQNLSHPPAQKRSIQFLKEKLDSNRIDYTWFATKAKIKYEDKKNKASFTAIIRMQKDSLIWIALKKTSIEGFRIRITPNNIEILDRQENTYTKKTFNYLKTEFGLDLTFPELQDLIIGNPILLGNQNLVSTIIEKKNVLQTPENQKNVLKIFLLPPDFLIHEIRASANNNAISITFSEYAEIQNQKIAISKTVEIDSEDIGIIHLQMNFSDIILNEVQKVGFEIPR